MNSPLFIGAGILGALVAGGLALAHGGRWWSVPIALAGYAAGHGGAIAALRWLVGAVMDRF